MADSGAKSPKNPTFKHNNALARIVTLQRQFPGMRQDQYEEMVKRERATEARKERAAEEAEQKRIARLEQEDADLEELETKTKNASLSQKLFDIGCELVVPQDKMDWALLILGGIGKVGKAGNIIKILDKEKALAEIAKKRKAVQDELRARQKAKKGTVVEKKGKRKPHKNCGKLTKYNQAPPRKDDGLEADHIPSGAALKKAAENELKEMGIWKRLTQEEQKSVLNKVYNNALIILVPDDVHEEGRSHGYKNTTDQINEDAADLNKAAKKDVDATKKAMKNKSHGCKGAYKKAADELLKTDFNQYVKDTVLNHPAVKNALPK